jgi:hypothetical protein
MNLRVLKELVMQWRLIIIVTHNMTEKETDGKMVNKAEVRTLTKIKNSYVTER